MEVSVRGCGEFQQQRGIVTGVEWVLDWFGNDKKVWEGAGSLD